MEKTDAGRLASVALEPSLTTNGGTMPIQLTHVNQWVHDQDEALAFYTEKLGMELRDDVTVPEMGNFRWLTVGPVGQPDIAVVLMAVPGPPVFDEETAAQLRDLVAKGATGGLFFSTDDCQGHLRRAHPPAASSSRRSRWSVRTGSTPASAIPRGIRSGSFRAPDAHPAAGSSTEGHRATRAR